MSGQHENKEIIEMMEKESPKNIFVSFVLSMAFGIAAGLAAIAYSETLLNLCFNLIYSLDVENTTQYTGFRRLSQITSLGSMLLFWIIAFMIVWHKIEKAPSMKKRVRFGVTAIIVALALFGIFELVGYSVIGTWLYLTGAIF